MHAPNNADLEQLWSSATGVEIYDGGVRNGTPLTGLLLLKIEDPVQLDEFSSLLEIADGEDDGFICMCLGDLAIVVLGADQEPLAVFGFHHGTAIRWDGHWEWDAELRAGDAVVEWLETHGVVGPAEYRSYAQAMRRQANADNASWIEDAPHGLRSLAVDLVQTSSTAEIPAELIAAVRSQLNTSFDSSRSRIQALLAWFGSGSGKCSGYAFHEGFPGTLLLEYTMSELAEALDPADQRQLDGALRLFAGYEFRGRRSELSALSTDQRQALTLLATATNDEDKKSRAKQVFPATSD